MSSAYFAPLVLLPDVISGPGRYVTRAGEFVTVTNTSTRHDFGNTGTYADGRPDSWHKSGRIFATRESLNDIVAREG